MSNSITFNDLIEIVKTYNPSSINDLIKAYEYASILHKNQKRQSGEDYIVHPLNVAYTLALMHADSDTLCAGLLHDTLEDTTAKKEDIEEKFNSDVANMVDGVSEINQLYFNNKEEEKQKKKSIETMEIYAPLAYLIGAYEIKQELEDLSFKYLNPKEYFLIKDEKEKIKNEYNSVLNEMLFKIKSILESKNVPNEIKIRTKNIYGLYKKKIKGENISSIDDLMALKIIVDDIDNCYKTLGIIHRTYNPFNERFKDHICNPKTNRYQSLHTTVFAPDNRLLQIRVRTDEMDKISKYGISFYWYINNNGARTLMMDELKNKYQFFDSLVKIDEMFKDDKEFVNQVKEELFSNRVYVYTNNGDIIELPEHSTIIDFAFKINPILASKMTSCVVNNYMEAFNYELKNKDRVKIITDDNVDEIPFGWESIAKTSYAKKMIQEYRNM